MSPAVGKLLVVLGLLVVILGLLLWLAPGTLRWMGKLPGDIRGEHFSFPIVTCLVISVVLVIVVNLVARLFR